MCDKEFFELEAPGPVADEYKGMCSSVESVVVSGEGSTSSSIFSAKSSVIDPYKM